MLANKLTKEWMRGEGCEDEAGLRMIEEAW